LIPNF